MEPIKAKLQIFKPGAEATEIPCQVLAVEAQRVRVGYEAAGKPVTGYVPHGHVKGVDTLGLWKELSTMKAKEAAKPDPRVGKTFHVKLPNRAGPGGKAQEFEAKVLEMAGLNVRTEVADEGGKTHQHTFPVECLGEEVGATPPAIGVEKKPAPDHGKHSKK